MRTVLVLFLGPASHRHALLARHGAHLRERGLKFVLADDYVTTADAALFDDVVQVPAPENVGEVVAALERVPCDAIYAQSEAALLPGALLARRRGRRGLGVEAALRCAAKNLRREALARAGVPQPDFAVVRTAAAVRRFAAGRYPVVLKGVASTMARLVTLVRAEGDVEAAVARLHALLPESTDVARLTAFCRAAGVDPGCDPARDFLVEAYAAGDPVETDGVVAGPEPLTYGCLTQVLSPPPLFYVEGYLLPSDRADEAAFLGTSAAALRALEVRDTGFSIEMRATDAGPRVIEVNGRLGEDDGFGDMFAAATGGDPFLHALELALGERPRVNPAHGARCALAYRSCYEEGVVRRVPAAFELADVAGGHGDGADLRLGLAAWEGQRLHAPGHPEAFPHLAWALARHASSSRAAYADARRAVDRLAFEVAP